MGKETTGLSKFPKVAKLVKNRARMSRQTLELKSPSSPSLAPCVVSNVTPDYGQCVSTGCDSAPQGQRSGDTFDCCSWRGATGI